MFKNKGLIGIVSNGYWSFSQYPGNNKAWTKKFGSGEQILIEKKWPGKVRAIKIVEKKD